MSRRLEQAAFTKKVLDLLQLYDPADHWTRLEDMRRLERALSRLTYFEVTKSGSGTGLDPMFEIKGRFRVSRRVIDLVMIDVETVWTESRQAGEESFHLLTPDDHGFRLRSATVRGRLFVTGELFVAAVR